MICPRCHKSTLATNHRLLLNDTCCWRCVGIDELVAEIARLTTNNESLGNSVKKLGEQFKAGLAENDRLTTENKTLKKPIDMLAEIATARKENVRLTEKLADVKQDVLRASTDYDGAGSRPYWLVSIDETLKDDASAAPKPTCNLCHGTGRIMSDVEMDGYETRP